MHDWTLDEAATGDVIKHALDLGINFFDTANGYSAGTSEEYLGRALKKQVDRSKVVIASKVYFNPGRLSREAIFREIDGSLKRLGTDYLDLYIIHRFDYATPMEETMEALNDLVKAGKVRLTDKAPTWRSHIVRTASSARSTTILPTALYFLMKKSNLFQIRCAVIVAADFLLNLNFF